MQFIHYDYDIHGNVANVVYDDPSMDATGTRYTLINYDYDLVTGNVKQVSYQAGKVDAFYHKYEYDSDNRISKVYTSPDGIEWSEDATYEYYKHGPLARSVLGNYKVQGTDYAYTIQGWLKGVNSNELDETMDMGQDANASLATARDAFGFSLNYYTGDYSAISGSNTFLNDQYSTSLTDLYNGNISGMQTALMNPSQGIIEVLSNRYSYDQLNRLKAMNCDLDGVSTSKYATTYSYDHSGNITSLTRKGDNASYLDMDNLSYHYATDNNQLQYVSETVTGVNYPTDLDNQTSQTNYEYDDIGNLIEDEKEKIDEIKWNVQGKVTDVIRTSGSGLPDLEFKYDPLGNRIIKIVKTDPTDDKTFKYTFYRHDASGNLMATYEAWYNDNTDYWELWQREVYLYGSNRLGRVVTNRAVDTELLNPPDVFPVSNSTYYTNVYNTLPNIASTWLNLYMASNTFTPDLVTGTNLFDPTDGTVQDNFQYRLCLTTTEHLGAKEFELSNHLGNVLVVVSDRKLPQDADTDGTIDYYLADVVSTTDYYPFGMQMPGRTYGISKVDATIASYDFASNVTGWSGWGLTVSHDVDKLKAQGTGAWSTAYTNLTLEVGKRYRVTAWVGVGNTPRIKYMVKNTSDGTFMFLANTKSDGYVTFEFVATSTSVDLIFQRADGTSSNLYFYLDDVKVEEISEYYRFGFNGKEQDPEVSGSGNVYDYGFRIYNPRIARFLSVDPLTRSYPWYTPYQFAGNMPIAAIDLDGLEEYIVVFSQTEDGTTEITIHYIYEEKSENSASKPVTRRTVSDNPEEEYLGTLGVEYWYADGTKARFENFIEGSAEAFVMQLEMHYSEGDDNELEKFGTRKEAMSNYIGENQRYTKEIIRVRKVAYYPNMSSEMIEDTDELAKVIDDLRRASKGVMLIGYTDRDPMTSYIDEDNDPDGNIRLSNERAQDVKNTILDMSEDVDEDRIITRGAGSSQANTESKDPADRKVEAATYSIRQ
jgi:RHS repeat-associated protein